ncbi:hypothetical protein Gotur_026738 [Gossypium turneri]
MLNGSIPEAFNNLRGLRFVNISFNQFEGSIPNLKAFHEALFDALRNNKGLCGNATGLMACVTSFLPKHGHGKRTKVIISVTLPLFGGPLLLFLLEVSLLSAKGLKPKTQSQGRNKKEIFLLYWHLMEEYSIQHY